MVIRSNSCFWNFIFDNRSFLKKVKRNSISISISARITLGVSNGDRLKGRTTKGRKKSKTARITVVTFIV